MKNLLLAAFISASFLSTNAQIYFSRTGYLGMYSKTNMEDIKADNNKVSYIINFSTNQIEISCLQTAFEFEKALMQEHYNENYVQSEKYPRAVFKGKIEPATPIDLKKDGTYKIKASGNLEMHGVTKPMAVDGVVKISAGKVSVEAKFPISCKDFNIQIESALKDNISDKIDVTAKADLAELKK